MKARNPLRQPRGYLLPAHVVSATGRRLSLLLTPERIGIRERRGKVTHWLDYPALWRLAGTHGRAEHHPGGQVLRVACGRCGARGGFPPAGRRPRCGARGGLRRAVCIGERPAGQSGLSVPRVHRRGT